MLAFEVPPLLIDPATLPPSILTSEPGSFAQETLQVRIPHLIEEAVAFNAFPPDLNHALEELRREILQGLIKGLREDTADSRFWDQVSAPWIGRLWLDVPFYFAEAFFYRRLLEATRYFQPGPWFGFDPFRAKKREDVDAASTPRFIEAVLTGLPVDFREAFVAVLHASLWGNRIDLSYAAAAELGRQRRDHDERANLLVDDTARVWEFLSARSAGRVAILADNAGSELLTDLVLADFLLSARLATEVTLYLKPQPFFVSDATPADVEPALEALVRAGERSRALGDRVRRHLRRGQLALRTHWHLASGLFFFQLPDDLRTELAGLTLVIVKGDANYRRLLGDAHWPPTTRFAQATAYFPAPLVALRTLKAELIVGLLPGEAERLYAEDPRWQVNAKRGVVQAKF